MHGNHVLKTWSTTQAVIAISSGEAEFYAMVKGGSIGLGMKAIFEDMGENVGIEMKTDASAAKAIASRKGLGKVRHMAVHLLWLQERIALNDAAIHKI